MERADFLRVRSEGRGTRRSPANVLRVALAHRPPDCRPKEPQVTQNAPNARRPSPQPKATSRGSAAQPGRVGPGAVRKVWGVVHGVHWIQIRITNANFHALRAGRNALALPRRRLRVHPQASPRRLVRDQCHPRDPGRQTRVRCACRVAPWRWGSNSASPPILGRAPTQPEPSISKSSPRDLEFQYPVVATRLLSA